MIFTVLPVPQDLPYPRRCISSKYSLASPLQSLKPSACTPLFLAAFTLRSAGCCIHTHSQWAVLVTLLAERTSTPNVFAISTLEQIKGIPRGYGPDKVGNLGFYDTLRIPIIENTAHEEDLKESLEAAMEMWPDTHAVLVKRHGM